MKRLLCHQLTILLILFALFLSLSACLPTAELETRAATSLAGGPINTTRTPKATQSAEEVAATAEMAATLQLTLTRPVGTPTRTSAEATATGAAAIDPSPYPFPSPTPVPPFPGIIYRAPTGLWAVGENWQPSFLSERADGVPAPDGNRILYVEGDDIWLLNRVNGEQRNLTNTPDQIECCPQWWPARPNLVLFGVDPQIGSTNTAVFDLDSGEYTIIDAEKGNAAPAPAPDGRRIAYDTGGTAKIYDLETGSSELFDPLSFAGLPGNITIPRIGAPSWSPDGSKLAWVMAVQGPDFPGDPWQIALGVFDLPTQTAHLLHPYRNAGRGGWFPPAPWSPDGRWLAFVSEAQDTANFGLWIISTDGNEETFLGSGGEPVWSPDGRWLIYHSPDGVKLVEAASWYQIEMYLPEEGNTVIKWLPALQ